MPARYIQRYPLGLLGLVDLKDDGRGPSLFSETLVPTVDGEKYYLASKRQTNSGSAANVNGTGFFAATGLTIPSQAVWQVDWLSAYPSAVLGAATTVRFHLAVARANSTVPIAIGEAVTGTTGERPAATMRDFLVLPGDQLGVWVDAWLAGGVAFNANLFCGISILNY